MVVGAELLFNIALAIWGADHHLLAIIAADHDPGYTGADLTACLPLAALNAVLLPHTLEPIPETALITDLNAVLVTALIAGDAEISAVALSPTKEGLPLHAIHRARLKERVFSCLRIC